MLLVTCPFQKISTWAAGSIQSQVVASHSQPPAILICNIIFKFFFIATLLTTRIVRMQLYLLDCVDLSGSLV